MTVLITKAQSFIGKNLVENLKNIKEGKNRTRPNLSISDIIAVDEVNNDDGFVDTDFVFSLPGTAEIADVIKIYGNKSGSTIIYIGTVYQSDNEQEELFKDVDNALIYRFPEIVGKWQEPTDGIAKLCYAVANDEEYVVPEESKSKYLLFIDDFIEEMLDAMEGHPHRCNYPKAGERSEDPTDAYDGITPVPNEEGKYCYSPKACHTTVSNIIKNLESFNRMNDSSLIPEIPQGSLAYKLFSMYLSYLPERKMSYPLNMNVDNRGVFTELIKTSNNGQVSINIARPGNVRGQHWHNCKWEIFIVVSGHGLIQERKIGTDEVIDFEVRGEDMRAVIMLPGYSHNIINLEKDRDLVTVMYANEQFDSKYPDTFFEPVNIIESELNF